MCTDEGSGKIKLNEQQAENLKILQAENLFYLKFSIYLLIFFSKNIPNLKALIAKESDKLLCLY